MVAGVRLNLREGSANFRDLNLAAKKNVDGVGAFSKTGSRNRAI